MKPGVVFKRTKAVTVTHVLVGTVVSAAGWVSWFKGLDGVQYGVGVTVFLGSILAYVIFTDIESGWRSLTYAFVAGTSMALFVLGLGFLALFPFCGMLMRPGGDPGFDFFVPWAGVGLPPLVMGAMGLGVSESVRQAFLRRGG